MLIRNIFAKLIVILMSILTALNISIPLIPENESPNACPTVFVHGLMGWGENDPQYAAFPHWGMLGGDMITRFRSKGYECYAASVAPTGSVWDRACELYAQLAGTRTDYGKAHSEKYGHDRYGKDFTNSPLMKNPWSEENKINLIGHSMGGATVRLLVSLLYQGNAQEQSATTDGTLSPLFEGGKSSLVHAVAALSAPHNGTSSFEAEDWASDKEGVSGEAERWLSENDPTTAMFNGFVNEASDENGMLPDMAYIDLTIDGAAKVNEGITTAQDVWYFSVATDCTELQEDGTYKPIADITESMFMTRSVGMGKIMFTTPGGIVVDEKWLPNDGLVNVISARYPFNEPHTEFDFGDPTPQKGIWNVLPDVRGDHTYFIGDLLKIKDVSGYYFKLLTLFDSLPIG